MFLVPIKDDDSYTFSGLRDSLDGARALASSLLTQECPPLELDFQSPVQCKKATVFPAAFEASQAQGETSQS